MHNPFASVLPIPFTLLEFCAKIRNFQTLQNIKWVQMTDFGVFNWAKLWGCKNMSRHPKLLQGNIFSFFVPHRQDCFSGAELWGWTQSCSVGARFAPLAGLQSWGQRCTIQHHLASKWPAAASGGGWLNAVFGQWISTPASFFQGWTSSQWCGGGLQLCDYKRSWSPHQPNCKCSPSK